MITRAERSLASNMESSFGDIRTQWIARARAEHGRIAAVMEWYESNGFERIDVGPGAMLTPDGREVLWVRGVPIALRQDVHDARMIASMAEAESLEQSKRAEQSPSVREGIAATTCPQMCGGKPCGGTLNRVPVCPSCVTGRMGYRYRYTCESCGCDIVTREELR